MVAPSLEDGGALTVSGAMVSPQAGTAARAGARLGR
jgi:hypothetical protein